jgi:serine/threonine protein kinase
MIGQGSRLKDRYQLEQLLGRGGMASVWLASDEVLERPVAVKVLSDTIASDPEFLARFRREARVAAGLSHPNLIDIYDFAGGAERPYLVMEYVPGENLAERTQRGDDVGCERLARELLGALAHIHGAGIVHRDVKPQNVLIGPDGSAKLIDFGIALTEDATALTQTGHLLGTARYIAPEVMRGEPATERSDLYSCGIVLRDCIGESHSRRLGALVDRLSAADPVVRPASATTALTQVGPKTFTPIPDQPTERLHSAPVRSWRKATAVVVTLAALAVTFLLISGGNEQTGGIGDDANDTANGRAEPAPTAREEVEASKTVPEPAGDDPALASSLNEEGFAMIQAGDYEGAIPVLEEAIRTFPPGTDDLNYAYALFNLGSALRLSGRPEEAIPVLEQRLEIPNQTEAVRSELEAARSEAN